MNVWPQDELWKTISAICIPILKSPLVAWNIYASLLNRFSNKEVITLGEFGNIVGFSLLLLCVGFGILAYCGSAYDGMREEDKKDGGAIVGFYIVGFIGLYLALYFLLKLFYKY